MWLVDLEFVCLTGLAAVSYGKYLMHPEEESQMAAKDCRTTEVFHQARMEKKVQ